MHSNGRACTLFCFNAVQFQQNNPALINYIFAFYFTSRSLQMVHCDANKTRLLLLLLWCASKDPQQSRRIFFTGKKGAKIWVGLNPFRTVFLADVFPKRRNSLTLMRQFNIQLIQIMGDAWWCTAAHCQLMHYVQRWAMIHFIANASQLLTGWCEYE